MLDFYISIICEYGKLSFDLYKKATKDRHDIHEYTWKNNELEDFILTEIELLESDIAGFAHSLCNGKFSRCEETINFLEKKSIYDNKEILSWLSEEKISKYYNFHMHILFLENYRILTIKTCREYIKSKV